MRLSLAARLFASLCVGQNRHEGGANYSQGCLILLRLGYRVYVRLSGCMCVAVCLDYDTPRRLSTSRAAPKQVVSWLEQGRALAKTPDKDTQEELRRNQVFGCLLACAVACHLEGCLHVCTTAMSLVCLNAGAWACCLHI